MHVIGRLYVSNMTEKMSKAELNLIFDFFGKVSEIRVKTIKNEENNLISKIGYVEF